MGSMFDLGVFVEGHGGGEDLWNRKAFSRD